MKKCAEAEDDGSGQASKGSRGSDPRPRGPTVGKSSLTAHVGSDPVHQASYALGSDQPFARIYHRHRKITIAKKNHSLAYARAAQITAANGRFGD